MKKYGRCNDREKFVQLFSESRSLTELGKKLGYSIKNKAIPGGVSKLLRQKIEEYDLDVSVLNGQGWSKGLNQDDDESIAKQTKSRETPWDKCFCKRSSVHNQRLLRRLIRSGKRQYKCEECGIIEWNGITLVLNIHHKNEIFNDNREDNLEILCPNCHSIKTKGPHSLMWMTGQLGQKGHDGLNHIKNE